jgi:hypothetical protein
MTCVDAVLWIPTHPFKAGPTICRRNIPLNHCPVTFFDKFPARLEKWLDLNDFGSGIVHFTVKNLTLTLIPGLIWHEILSSVSKSAKTNEN